MFEAERIEGLIDSLSDDEVVAVAETMQNSHFTTPVFDGATEEDIRASTR